MKTLTVLCLAAAGLVGQVQQEPVTLATMKYVDLTVGTGAPALAGKRFTVHYTGWLKDGTKFDSSVDRNEPFSFVQGRREVISGWDIGFEGMKVGGKRKLFIPYQLAYGEAGRGAIPPKAELIFDVELLGVSDAPAAAAAVDVLVPLGALEEKAVALARSVPEGKWGAVAPYLGRIAAWNEEALAGAEKDEPGISEWTAEGPAEAGREALVDRLAASFAAVKKRLEGARNNYLNADAVLLGKATTRRGLFTGLVEAVGEQYGAALAVSGR